MHKILSTIESAYDLHEMSLGQLEELADEIRDALCNLLACRTAHFASNLGVVELSLALHSVFDFRRDRLLWDTGHQIYPHKLITRRYKDFASIRTKGGLMGYPNPAESDYDLFMTGHAGCSISTAMGLRVADVLQHVKVLEEAASRLEVNHGQTGADGQPHRQPTQQHQRGHNQKAAAHSDQSGDDADRHPFQGNLPKRLGLAAAALRIVLGIADRLR